MVHFVKLDEQRKEAVMIPYAQDLVGALASATVPTELIVPPAYAWVLLVTLLAAACAALWFLTKPPVHGADSAPPNSPTRRHSGKTASRVGPSSHNPQPALVAHRGNVG